MRASIAIILILLFVIPQSLIAQTQTKPASSSSGTPKDFDNSLQVVLEIIKEYGLVDDPVQQKRLDDIGYRVAQRSSADLTHLSFFIVKMDEPNAFALPGGFIFVTSGMLELNLTDDELAALLGHEITHVRNEHSRKLAKRQTIMNLLYQALIVGIAVGLKDDGSYYDPVTGAYRQSKKSEILQGSSAFGLVFQELLLRGFSREMELEADHDGMIAASRAGFSPKGTVTLFEKMHQSIYEAPGFGYWRTHPYLDDRTNIARSFSATLEPAKNPADATDFRKTTQQNFLQYKEKQKDDAAKKELRDKALDAYPVGETAGELRSEIIAEKESEETKKDPFFRDYGKLKTMYEENLQALKQDSISTDPSGTTVIAISHPPSDLVAQLEKKLDDLKKQTEEVKPQYEKVLTTENFDTDTLRRFISNFPDSPQLTEVQYRLAENYRVLNKKKEAVDLYLTVLKSEGDSPWKEKSKASLLQTVPTLEDLSACYKVSIQTKDPQLIAASEARMKSLSETFSSLQIGYEFRRSYHSSPYEKSVRDHMTKLADDTLHKAKLYQAVGEYQKALDHYNEILRYCSDLPIADQVKDSIIDFQQLSAVKGTG
jgi:predicted Zn-dependent protease